MLPSKAAQKLNLFDLLKGDFEMMLIDRSSRQWVNVGILMMKLLIYPRYQAVILFRFSQLFYKLKLVPLSHLLQSITLIISGAEIHPAAQIAPGLSLIHTSGIVIGDRAVIGRCFRCHQGVTIGDAGKWEDLGQPTIGDRVTAFADCKLLGSISIGDDATIGANAVLMIDVPPRGVAVGMPARIVTIRPDPTSPSA